MDAARVLGGLALPALALLLLLVLIWATQRSLIYFPDARAVPSAERVLSGAEEVVFWTDDGLRLRGWFVPARGQASATVLVLSGNAGNRADRAALASALASAGLAVLLFDYRGYGGNPGSPSEQGLLRDARAAHGYVAAHPGSDPRRIVYFGESLGAAVAVALAAERPPLALVLRSPFTSLADIAAHHYPYLPIHPLLLRDRYSAIEVIGALRAPLLVIAGDRDRIVPPRFSRQLYDAARNPKRFVLISGADHNDSALLAGDALISEVARFVQEAFGPQGRIRTGSHRVAFREYACRRGRGGGEDSGAARGSEA